LKERPKNAFESVNLRNHRHVSATHVTIFRMVRTRIQTQSCVGKICNVKKS